MVSGDEGRMIEKRMVVEYGVTLDGVLAATGHAETSRRAWALGPAVH